MADFEGVQFNLAIIADVRGINHAVVVGFRQLEAWGIRAGVVAFGEFTACLCSGIRSVQAVVLHGLAAPDDTVSSDDAH